MEDRNRTGMVHVYTGNGKGKTTAAIGLAVRAAGHGLRVYIGQFMKGVPYGELIALKRFQDLITIEQFGRAEFVHPEKPTTMDIRLAREGLKKIDHILQSRRYHLVILDEINVAIAYHLVPVQDVVRVLQNRPLHTEVVCTGRYAPEELLEMADLVTEMEEQRHYFQRGIASRKGFDF